MSATDSVQCRLVGAQAPIRLYGVFVLINPFLYEFSCSATPTMNNYINFHIGTKKFLVRSTSIGSDISYFHKQTE